MCLVVIFKVKSSMNLFRDVHNCKVKSASLVFHWEKFDKLILLYLESTSFSGKQTKTIFEPSILKNERIIHPVRLRMKVDSPWGLFPSCGISWRVGLLLVFTLTTTTPIFFLMISIYIIITTCWKSLTLREFCWLENSPYSICLQIESFEMAHETSNPSSLLNR